MNGVEQKQANPRNVAAYLLRVNRAITGRENVVDLDVFSAQGLYIMDERPALVGRNDLVFKRGHGRAGETRGHAQIQITAGVPAAKCPGVEIAGRQRKSPDILEGRRGGAVALARQSVADKAIHLGIERLTIRQ